MGLSSPEICKQRFMRTNLFKNHLEIFNYIKYNWTVNIFSAQNHFLAKILQIQNLSKVNLRKIYWQSYFHTLRINILSWISWNQNFDRKASLNCNCLQFINFQISVLENYRKLFYFMKKFKLLPFFFGTKRQVWQKKLHNKLFFWHLPSPKYFLSEGSSTISNKLQNCKNVSS